MWHNFSFIMLSNYESITSNRDHIFLSTFWTEFSKLRGLDLRKSSSYHPHYDGQTDVFNKCLETYFGCMTDDQPTWWYKWLFLAEWRYKTNVHSSIHTNVLVQWKDLPLDKATYEFYHDLLKKIPDFHPWGHGCCEEEGIVIGFQGSTNKLLFFLILLLSYFVFCKLLDWSMIG